jgi:hypothetical protein
MVNLNGEALRDLVENQPINSLYWNNMMKRALIISQFSIGDLSRFFADIKEAFLRKAKNEVE